MTKIVINKCYGGYGLSKEAVLRLRELGCDEAIKHPVIAGEKWEGGQEYTFENERMYSNSSSILSDDRKNPLLIQVV